MLFAHGFGCDQNMWRHVEPSFRETHRTVLFDYVGAGGSDLSAYDLGRYSSLSGYARDVLDVCDALDLSDVIFVGHSVSAMIGVLASIERPGLFAALVLVGPSPRYVNDDGYTGGFDEADIAGLLESLESNYLGWSTAMAPAIVGNPDRPELGAELTESFCRTDPDIQKHFAKATFLSDNRDDLARVNVPTLVLQCADDIIAPVEVGRFVHERIAASVFVQLEATGHCPNLERAGGDGARHQVVSRLGVNGAQEMLGEPDEAFYAALLEDDPEALYERAPCGYLSTLPDGTIVKANGTFFAWTGFDREQILGRKRFQELLPAGDRIFYETHYAPLLQMQSSVREIAVELTLPDGTRLPVLANSVLERDPTGRPLIVRTVLFDARERRSYERELVEARRRAEESEARARALAQTLQSTFLPPTELAIPGLDVAGAYRPAGDGSEVGGDFYDVFETGRGTHAVVLGDVSGKGAEAAVVTALARYSVRAEVLRDSSPAAVLRTLHDAMASYQPDRFLTALLLDVAVGSELVVTIAAAGHQLPLLLDGDGARQVGVEGSIVGMLPTVDVTDSTVVLRPGQSLVLYTDGMSEARQGGVFFGDDRVADLASRLAAFDAEVIVSGLVEAAVSFQGGDARDDIAVLVLKSPPT